MEPSQTIGQRIKVVRGELSQKAFGLRIGLSQTAVTALETNQSEPRLGTFSSIVDAFGVNPEWLRTGTGPMLRDGRALTPAPRAAEPAADYTSANSTEQTLYISVLKEQVADLKSQVHDLKEDKADLKAEVSELRGKPFDSSDAAGPTTYPTDPTDPRFAGGVAPLPMIRKRAGFAPSYVEAAELS